MKNMNINIGNKEYLLKQSIRSLMLFEQLTQKKAADIEDNLSDTITIFYCMLKANNKDFDYTFEQFVDMVEVDEQLIDKYIEFLKNYVITKTVDKTEKKKI